MNPDHWARHLVLVAMAWSLLQLCGEAASLPEACRQWVPPESSVTHTAGSTRELTRLLEAAEPDTTILLKDGEYRLDRMLDIAVEGLTLRGESSDRSRVIIRGDGMAERRVGVAISVSAQRVTLADLTVGYVGYHAVQVRGERGASNATLHNVHLVDSGQHLLKGSVSRNGLYADDGLVACSSFEYTEHAPSSYAGGVNVIAGRGWVVRDNEFHRIRGPRENGWAAGPAILFWGNSRDTIVERNLVFDSFRGIAFGLGRGAFGAPRDDEPNFDHQGGAIRNNVVANPHEWADEGIELNAARDVRVDHNTVVVEGRLPWSISVRFSETSGWVRNNLSNRQIILRDQGTADMSGNVDVAERSWFVDPDGRDFRLKQADVAAIDVGVTIPRASLQHDFDGNPRIIGPAPDAGAYEFGSHRR